MGDIFVDFLNISITASYIILAVLLIRLIFPKIPRKFVCILWMIAGIRLVLPISIESIFSLVPSTETFESVSDSGRDFQISSGISAIDVPVNDYLGDRYFEGVSVPQDLKLTVSSIVAALWLVGIVGIFIYGVFGYIRVKRMVKCSVLLKENIFECEKVVSPFILGFFKPKIYVPFGMDNETLDYVAAHENAHIKRRDHLIKPIGFIVLAVYWFNPLVWVAYIMLCRDIEAACDEKVIAEMDGETRKKYASSLLECAVNRRKIAACPLAFGEVSVKSRIKNVMSYKKPAFWVVVVAAVTCLIAAVCFLTNPPTKDDYIDNGFRIKIAVQEDGKTKETKTIIAQNGNYVILSNGTRIKIKKTDFEKNEVEAKLSGTPLYSEKEGKKPDGFVLNMDSYLSFVSQDGKEKITVEYIKAQSLGEAIDAGIKAVLGENFNDDNGYEVAAHTLYSTEVKSLAKTNETQEVTAYVTAAYGEYIYDGSKAVILRGESTPAAITFKVDNGIYVLSGFWTAELGRRYAESVKEKFPQGTAERAINDTETSKACQAKAEAYFKSLESENSEASQEVAKTIYKIYSDAVGSKKSGAEKYFGQMPLVEYEKGVEPIPSRLIKDKAELDDFISSMSEYFDFNGNVNLTFGKTAKSFDEKFFEENGLIILYVTEYSQTNYTVDEFHKYQQSNEGYALSLKIKRDSPKEIGDAVYERFITLAVDKTVLEGVNAVYSIYAEQDDEAEKIYGFSDGGLHCNAKLILYDENRIEFCYSLLSSYIPTGTYTLDDEKLVMKTDDGKFGYTFLVDGDSLIFDSSASSELPDFTLGDGTKYKPVPDRAVFTEIIDD